MAFRKINLGVTTSEVVDFTDSLMVLGKGNTTPTDIGILGKIGANTYTGLVRDSAEQKFYLIDSVTLTSATPNDVNPLQISKADLTLDKLEATEVEISTTFVLPKGSTAARPTSPVEGQMWFNTDTKMFEGYNGTEWKQLIPSTYNETT